MVMAPGSQRRSRGPVVAIMIIVAAVLVGAAIVTMGVLRVQDPTEDAFVVALKNDTSAPVVVRQCDVRCNSFHEHDRLVPSASVEVNTSDANVPNWWVVEDAAGRPSGCLRLQFDHKVSGAVVNVSTAVACPR